MDAASFVWLFTGSDLGVSGAEDLDSTTGFATVEEFDFPEPSPRGLNSGFFNGFEVAASDEDVGEGELLAGVAISVPGAGPDAVVEGTGVAVASEVAGGVLAAEVAGSDEGVALVLEGVAWCIR